MHQELTTVTIFFPVALLLSFTLTTIYTAGISGAIYILLYFITYQEDPFLPHRTIYIPQGLPELWLFICTIFIIIHAIVAASSLLHYYLSWNKNFISQWEQELPSQRTIQTISKLSTEVANKLQTAPFSKIIPATNFFIAGTQDSKDKILILDTSISDYLNPTELASLLAHEYAHFDEKYVQQYILIQKIQETIYFTNAILGDKTNKSLPLKFLSIITPKAFGMRYIMLTILHHILSINANLLKNILRTATIALKNSFYEAEYHCDKISFIEYGHNIQDALIKISMLAFIRRTYRRNNFPEKTVVFNQWRHYCSKNTTTHPSIISRIHSLDGEIDMKNVYYAFFESCYSRIFLDNQKNVTDIPKTFLFQKILETQIDT